ncbi:MAG: hypothetical protein AB9888_15290 [Bacteroidales bacterium]
MNKEMGRHNIYLSHQVWGALKIRSFDERSDASTIINYVLERFLKTPPINLQVFHYRPREEEGRQGRTVYIQTQVWVAIEEKAKQGKFSISSLIETLLSIYLGLVESDEEEPTPTANRYLKVGDTIFDLGENPIRIDSNGAPIKS